MKLPPPEMDESPWGRFKFNFDKRGLQASFNFHVKDAKRGRNVTFPRIWNPKDDYTRPDITSRFTYTFSYPIRKQPRLLDCSLKRVMLHCIKPINSTYTSLIFPIFPDRLQVEFSIFPNSKLNALYGS